jgi:hypothetical protein
MRGRVVEVFGDKAVVEADGERLLVEPIKPNAPFAAVVGAEIEVAGRRNGNVLVPDRLRLPSGAVLQREEATPAPRLGDASPSPADDSLEAQLAREGITIVGRPYRKRNYTEVAGRAANGRMVIAVFDQARRLQEIEDAEHTHIHPDSPSALPEPEVARLLASAGFSSIRLIDQRRFRFLYSAVGPRGERMELHVDRAGNVLKRVWLR